EWGIILSEIQAHHDPTLGPEEYAVRLREVEVWRATGTGSEAIAAQVSRTVDAHAWRLLGYRETEALVEQLKKTHASLIRELFPGRFSLTSLRVILRNLLREGLPIRDLPAILELLLEFRGHSQDPDQLTEFVRSGFAHYLCAKFSDAQGVLHALILEPSAEQAVLSGLRESSAALWLDLDLDTSLRILTSAARGVTRAAEEKTPVVVLCSPRPRRFLRRLMEPSFPSLPVMAYSEVAPLTEVRTFGLIGT
ncbi:MAG: FHIPEP family type III secretion protein, partial [Candidatus Eremiobacterota bacterium]